MQLVDRSSVKTWLDKPYGRDGYVMRYPPWMNFESQARRSNTIQPNDRTWPAKLRPSTNVCLTHSGHASPFNCKKRPRGAPAFALWPCIAVQVMTEGQHRCTQSGYALPCKWWFRDNTSTCNVAMPRCASKAYSMVYSFWPWLSRQSLTKGQHGPKAGKKKRLAKRVFFLVPASWVWWCFITKGLTELYPHS